MYNSIYIYICNYVYIYICIYIYIYSIHLVVATSLTLYQTGFLELLKCREEEGAFWPVSEQTL